MSQLISLSTTANQRFTANLDGDNYDITIKETNGVMSFTMIRNEVLLFTNLRIVAGVPFIPYRYLETGNFIIETQNDCIPYYTQFGITDFLLYFSPAEVVAARGA